MTPSGQITWQTFQVQGVQNLQNLQIQNAPGQQITLTPVQTLTLGQVAAGGALTSTPVSLSTAQLPNLQTVTVNSIDSAGIQLHQGENVGSPAGICFTLFEESCFLLLCVVGLNAYNGNNIIVLLQKLTKYSGLNVVMTVFI